jgi:hypothetical protein
MQTVFSHIVQRGVAVRAVGLGDGGEIDNNLTR